MLMQSGWCVGCNPSSVLGSIQLSGLPAPPAAGHRRLFALAPRGSAVSPQPSASSPSAESSSSHRWTSRFCSVARSLPRRLAAPRRCMVDGVSSAPDWGPSAAHRLTNQLYMAYKSAINLSRLWRGFSILMEDLSGGTQSRNLDERVPSTTTSTGIDKKPLWENI